MRIVCISDTHSLHDRIKVPDGDLLIHAGDSTYVGTIKELKDFNRYLSRLPHKYKIVIAGNHEVELELHPEKAKKQLTSCIYLQDDKVTLEGIRIYGSPWVPASFDDGGVFNLIRGSQLKKKWDKIPHGIDVLITHCPPYGHCDAVSDTIAGGCKDLGMAVDAIKPKYHVFGHIHSGYGIKTLEGTTYINAAICTIDYKPTNLPIVFDV